MDDTQYQQTIERLSAVNEVTYVTAARLAPDDPGDEDDDGAASASGDAEGGRLQTSSRPKRDLDLDEMVEQYASDKDYENARLALAVYYHRHGKGPFDLKDVKALGESELNLDMPDRIDMSLKRTKHDDNLVLRKQADGTYKVTPSGERYLKDTYGVSKGRAAPPPSGADE